MKVAGCTVHIVTEGMDEGPIIAQSAVPILQDDTAQSLADRVLIVEHKTYRLALQKIALSKGQPRESAFGPDQYIISI